MTARTAIAVLCALLFLIAACAPQNVLRAQPLNNSVPPGPDLCATVTCGADMRCTDGACVCADGLKKCGDSCISQSKCCSNSECGQDRFCQNGACVQQPVCKFNEQWDPDRKECACAEGAKFCNEQSKCIPYKSCCWHSDCGSRGDFRCAMTTYSADVCLQSDTKKCRLVHEGTKQDFVLSDQQFYTVRLQQIIEGGKFIVRVGNETTKSLAVNETAQAANISVFVDQLEVFGGYCREEPE